MLGLKFNHVSKRGHWWRYWRIYPGFSISIVNTLGPEQNSRHFTEVCSWQKSLQFDKNVLRFVLSDPMDNQSSLILVMTNYYLGLPKLQLWWILFGEASSTLNELTHWGRDKMDAISQTTLSNSFSWMKMLEFRLKFHWNLFHNVQ